MELKVNEVMRGRMRKRTKVEGVREGVKRTKMKVNVMRIGLQGKNEGNR